MSLLLVLVTYVTVFYSWWVNSPVETKIVNGRTVRTVQVRYNRFFWHTDPIWYPAFLFMEHVCGYERGGYAPMEHESVMELIK